MNYLILFKKTSLLKKIIIGLLITTIYSCSNDDDLIANLGTLEVKLALASDLSDIPLNDITVKVTNTVDNSVVEGLSDTNGEALFENLAIGTYNITATQSKEEYTISGTATNISMAQQETVLQTIEVNATTATGGLVIKEIYAAGANDFFVSLFKDQFIEIFNNSSETLYADGMYIVNIHGDTGNTEAEVPISTDLSIDEYIYADAIDQIPGSGQEYPVAAGKSIVIAFNAINFKEGNTNADAAIDNTDATLERYSVTWLEEQGRLGNAFFDLDNPAVPNMTNIYIYEATNMYVFNTYGTGAALISADVTFTDSDIIEYAKTGSTNTFKLMKIDIEDVVDGVDILDNSQAADYKRLPSAIDGGFSYLNADGTVFYSGLSSRRIKDEAATARFGRTILQDTNNSTLDFETIAAPDKYGYNQ